MHCFGGNTTLRGDLGSLVRDVHQVAANPLAKECIGLFLVPEVLHHNDLFFDLAVSLGWNPNLVKCQGTRVDLRPFFEDYALRRYGPESARRMTNVLATLARTVYATKDMTQPLYLHQLYTVFDFPNASVYAPPEQYAWTPILRKALEKALKEAHRQRGNTLYERDVVDMTRRYVGDVFNGIVPNIIYAWRARDKPRFEEAYGDASALMGCLRDVLWASPHYRLSTRTERSRGRPDFAQLVAQTRNVMSIWEGSANLDYPRRDDLAELIQGYYLPRLTAWRDKLAEVDPDAWSQPDENGLTQTYWDIGKKWIEEGAEMPTPTRSTLDEIGRILPKVRDIEGKLPDPAAKPLNLDFRGGLQGWSLSSRRMAVSIEPGAGPGGTNAFLFQTWPESSGGNLYLFQTVKGNSASISLDCLVEPCGESAFAGLRVEGYDASFRRVAECTYQWGNAWNYWPDRYRPDNVTPEWSIGASGFVWWWVGHYTIKQRLGNGTGSWQHLEVEPARDVDAVHGQGTWQSLNVKTLRVALVASTRRKEDPLVGAFANLEVEIRRPESQ